MQKMSLAIYMGMLFMINTEGLVLGGNTFIMQELSLGLYLGMLSLRNV